jgi:hypothetical protein
MNELGKVLVRRPNSHHSGREARASRTYHGRMHVGLSSPGACFLSAMAIGAGNRKVVLAANLAIDASGIPTVPFTRGTAKGRVRVGVLDVKERGIFRA